MPSILRSTLALTLSFLAFTSCSATRIYEGPALAAHEIVRVKGMSNADPLSGFRGTSVCAIDGVALDGCPRHIEFLPGTHILEMQAAHYGFTTTRDTVEATFEPGGRYVIGLAYPGMKPALIPTAIVTPDGERAGR